MDNIGQPEGGSSTRAIHNQAGKLARTPRVEARVLITPPNFKGLFQYAVKLEEALQMIDARPLTKGQTTKNKGLRSGNNNNDGKAESGHKRDMNEHDTDKKQNDGKKEKDKADPICLWEQLNSQGI